MSEDAILREVQRSNAEVSKTITTFQLETTAAFGRVDTAIGRIDERLEAHKGETNRRFNETGTDIELAHDRISKLKPGGGARTAGAAAGGGGLFVILMDRLIAFFNGGGGTPTS